MILPISNQNLMKKKSNATLYLIISIFCWWWGGIKEIKWNTIIGKVKEGVACQVDVELKPKAMKAL